jgi:adenylate kinase
MKIVIFGPQGSGKGTQADFLAEKINLPHITTGGLCRAEIAKNFEVGKELQALLNRGELASDEIINKLLSQRLAEADCEGGFILDGYPRNLAQAEFLDSIGGVDKAIMINLKDEVIIKRLSERQTCVVCGAIFNLTSQPSKVKDVCDKCSGKLITRSDDQEETIRRRLEIYHTQTEPLIEYYQQQNKLLTVDGEPAIPEVWNNVQKVLNI